MTIYQVSNICPQCKRKVRRDGKLVLIAGQVLKGCGSGVFWVHPFCYSKLLARAKNLGVYINENPTAHCVIQYKVEDLPTSVRRRMNLREE